MVGHCTVKIPPVYLSTQCHWDHYIKVGTETNWHIKLFETFKKYHTNRERNHAFVSSTLNT